MLNLLAHISNYFVDIFNADRRLGARKFTSGCFLMVLIFLLFLALIFWIETGPPG